MPTFERREILARVLCAWERQSADGPDFELLVLDDGSTDGTAELLAEIRPTRYNLRWERQENAGPAAARNRALALAGGKCVLFTGDDIEPTPDLLARHLEAHTRLGDSRAAVLGLTRWPPGEPTTATMRHIDGVGSQQFSYHFMKDGAEYDFRHLYTSNVSLPRQRLVELMDADGSGPFSTAFPAAAFEDAELGDRLARRGLRIVYRAAAVAFHHHVYTVDSFNRRQRRCGEMAAVLYELRPELRRYLDLELLEDLRLSLVGGSPGNRSETWSSPELERALAMARFYDPLPYDLVDDLLLPLFRFAYLEGLAYALYPRVAPRLLHHLADTLLPPAIARLTIEARRRGLPLP